MISYNKHLNLYFLLIFICFSYVYPADKQPLTINDLFNIKTCSSPVISPDGKWIAYTVTQQRPATDKPGPSYQHLYLISLDTKQIKPYITGKETISSPKWSPDSKEIAFLMSRGENAKTQVWSIRTEGGEARQISFSPTDVSFFQWLPDLKQKKIAYVAASPPSKIEEKLKEFGFDFIFYEENLKHSNIYMLNVNNQNSPTEAEQLTSDTSVWDFEFSPDLKTIAFSGSTKNLIDYKYMFTKIFLLDIQTKKVMPLTNNPGKLGNYKFSKDGQKIVYTAAKTREDHSVSQVFLIDLKTKETKNLTPANFKGHIIWANWENNDTIIYMASEGVWNNFYTYNINQNQNNLLLDGKSKGIVFTSISYTDNLEKVALLGSTSNLPPEVYYSQNIKNIEMITNTNPWLQEKLLGKQEIIKWKARDGAEIEGILIYPANKTSNATNPLIVFVHGGPEYHYSNGWLSNYFEPAQVLSGKGYLVFFPNYRASTGYGVDFAMEGFGDPAGKEFDDIADGIDYLTTGLSIADKNRVGLAGGSYGGYAAAWFASYYTKYVKAVVMFVGISDLISKMGTTDIPYEELYVHSGKQLEDAWDFFLKRSPIYYAKQSKTAVLIVGGTNDTRVHPSQSLEFYRRLKMNNHPAVRLVQYPGEGHGNTKQTSRIDLTNRLIQWFDWYLLENKPLDGPLPPIDLSIYYNVDLNDK